MSRNNPVEQALERLENAEKRLKQTEEESFTPDGLNTSIFFEEIRKSQQEVAEAKTSLQEAGNSQLNTASNPSRIVPK